MLQRLLTRMGTLLGVAVLLAALTAVSANAQSPTPEGTVIRSIGTVSFTDANGNTYAAVADTVDLTVGFVAGVDVIAGAATVGPASPSVNDTLSFTVANPGNGTDSVTISQSISVGGIITVTGYRVGAVTYPSLALLNAALAGTAIAQSANITVKVIYNVAAGTGGQSTVYTLTATSRRNTGVSDNGVTTVSPALTTAVSVTPDGAQNLQRLPSNGTNYTFNFTVTNNATGTDGFDLLASHPRTAITIVSVNGVAGDSTRITGVLAGASQVIAVVYSIGNVAAGSPDTLVLKARSVATPATSNNGFADITVIRPLLAIVKDAYRDNQTTLIGAGTVVPGEFIQYKITVTNNGSAPASTVQVTDALAAQLTFSGTTPDAAGWTLSNVGNNVSGNLAGTLAVGASRFFWVRASVK
ncbi:MAG TPA: hypothetical protein VFO67_19760 [Gemmatimonadales bacterium]|nr:hypothetical protein [Gemmatimonadales bacterium]